MPAIAAQRQAVIIHSTGSREELKQKVQAMGGTIRYEFKNLNAVSAIIPSKSAHMLAAVPGMKVNKSLPVRGPASGHSGIVSRAPAKVTVAAKFKLDREAVAKSIASRPADYLFNNALINAVSVQAAVILATASWSPSSTVASPTIRTWSLPSMAASSAARVSFHRRRSRHFPHQYQERRSRHHGFHHDRRSRRLHCSQRDCLIGALQNYSPDSILMQLLRLPRRFPLAGSRCRSRRSIYAMKVFPSNGHRFRRRGVGRHGSRDHIEEEFPGG